MGAVSPLKRLARGLAYWAAGDYLPVAFGGTGATTVAGARSGLGVAASGANADITTLGALAVPLSGFRNKLINPGFRVNQRAPSGTGSTLTANAIGHDRWKAGANGCTYSTNAAPGTIETYAVITAGTLLQIVEAGAVDGSPHVLSWSGNAVARASYTPAGSSSAITTPYAASPILIPAQSPNTTIQVEFYFNGSSGRLQAPQLEAGTVPTPYELRPYAVECLLCYRFFRSFPYRISPWFDAQTASTYQFLYFDNDCDFRVSPTIVSYSDDQGTVGQVAYIGSGGSVLSRAAAYGTAVDNLRRIDIQAYSTSRCAHGCSVVATAEL